MSVSNRNGTVDLVRLFAAFGVICIHVPFNTAAAGAVNIFFTTLCVPFFYVISLTYFISSFKKSKSVKKVAYKTWDRIILPYLAWTAIYVALMLIKNRFIGLSHGPNEFVFWRALLFGESAVQLYYLPQLVMLQAFAYSIYLMIVGDERKRIIGFLILCIAVGYYMLGYLNHAFGLTPVGYLTVYLAIAFIFSNKSYNTTLNYEYLAVGSLLVALSILEAFLAPRYPVLNSSVGYPIGGLGLLLLSFGIPTFNLSKRVILLCSVSYGVYLSHVIFLEGFEVIGNKLAHAQLQYNLVHKIILAGLIFIAAVLFTLLLRKNPSTKKIFLGD
jgi:peptidoglycan/LPS O-acetylase OafA/YrhL